MADPVSKMTSMDCGGLPMAMVPVKRVSASFVSLIATAAPRSDEESAEPEAPGEPAKRPCCAPG